MGIAAEKHWQYEAGWLKSPSYDLTLIFGVLTLAVVTGAIVYLNPALFWPVLIVDLWLLGYHHVIATFTKLAGTPEDRQENKFFIFYLPPIVLLCVVTLSQVLGIWSIVTIYFFWQWYHYTRQAYGISAFYRRKSKTPMDDNPYLFQAVLWSVPVLGVLYRCSQGWDKFLFLPIWVPPVPILVVEIFAVLTVFLVASWCVSRLMAWYQGRLVLAPALFMLSHFAAFFVGYIFISDINVGWLVANIWHNAQYILFVWLYNNNRFKAGVRPDAKWLSWSSQPSPVRIISYFVGCLAITGIFYGTMQGTFKVFFGHDPALISLLYVVAFQTVNFHHYIVDSFIWKARKKQHQDVMSQGAP